MMFPVQNNLASLNTALAFVWLSTACASAGTYHWTGSAGGNFSTPANWVENSWSQWSDYVFDSNVTGGTASLDIFFGSGNLSLNNGLTRPIVINGPNPLVMAAPWGPVNGGTITIAANSRDLTINAPYYSVGSLTWNVGTGRILTVNGTVENWNGTASVIKQGEGTAVLTGINPYTGGTTVDGGLLELAGSNSGNSVIRGSLTVNAGAQVLLTGGDGTGLGFNVGSKVDTLTISGGSVTSPGTHHIWNMSGGVNLSGGTLQSNNGVSDSNGAHLEWGATTVNTLPDSLTSTIGGRIRIRRDASPYLTCNVADGPVETDLLISAALSQTGPAGLVKTGPGTLRITGAVLLTGVISVEEGTLDFSPSSVVPEARISVASSARLKLSNTVSKTVKNLYIDGQQLAAGTWGAPGSVAAGLAGFESPSITGSGLIQVTGTGTSNRERWRTMKYGQFTHYVYQGGGMTVRTDGSVPGLEELANSFDANQYADDLQSMGIEYVIFTAWHGNFFPLFNSAAMVRALGFQRNSSRDMVGDMISAVRAKGIRVLLYTHPNQPLLYDFAKHNDMINDIYGEVMDRYGDQIDGFWIDENDPGGNQQSSVDYPRLERTIRRRNPDVVMIQNNYGNLYSAEYGASEWGPPGENYSPDIASAGTQSIARVMAPNWGTTVSINSTSNAAKHSAAGIFRATVLAAGSNTDGGGVAWAAGPYSGAQSWEPGVLATMQAVGAMIAPVAASIKNTLPSNSWPTQEGTSIGSLQNGITATRSPDNTKEFIHVLNPPSSRTLTLPPPADGRIFSNARLLTTGAALTFVQNPREIAIALPNGTSWNSTDTVIVLDVVSPGDRTLVNNTSPKAVYRGSWSELTSRSTTEFGRDVHETTVNGSSVEFSFDGTDIELLATSGPDSGQVDVFLDGVFKQSVDARSPADSFRKVIYRGTGLARGNHLLKAVKKSGTRFTVDAFRATELIDSNDPAIAYQAQTFFNNTETADNGVGYIVYEGNWSWQQRDRNEYNNDVQWAQTNGSAFNIHFNGTGVRFIGTDQGIIDFHLDGTFVKQVNMHSFGSLTRNVGIDIKGLPPGNHVLRGVKAGDTYIHVDAFYVYNALNSGWSNHADPAAIAGGWRGSSTINDTATLAFEGTGIEILAPHSNAGGTVAVSIEGVPQKLVSQYAGNTSPQSVTYSSNTCNPLASGRHLLSAFLNRSFGSIRIDAFRVHKGRPDSASAFRWGPSGGGGSGIWDTNTTPNWFDGTNPAPWIDRGESDYTARFGGSPGTVTLSSGIRANRLYFETSGYTLTGGSLELTGDDAALSTAAGVSTTITSPLAGTASLIKRGAGTLTLGSNGSYNGGTNVEEGTLVLTGSISSTASVTIDQGAELRLGGQLSTSGALINYGTLTFDGNPQLSIGGQFVNYGTVVNRSPVFNLPANLVNHGTIIQLPQVPDGLLLADRFDASSNSASLFNQTLASDQQGLLAPLGYTVTTGGQDWQAQHGNGGVMLLVGDAGYGARASPDRDFSIIANTLNLPLIIEFDGWVSDTTVGSCWFGFTLGNARNILPIDGGAKFGILPKVNGAMEVRINAGPGLAATHSGNSYQLVFSNSSGNGSAFNGNGSKVVLYNGENLVGTYTLPQLSAGDGYLSFAANPYNGSWNLTRIDQLRISTPPGPSDYQQWAASLGIASPDDDDDHDGLDNFTEYAFGLDPKNGGSNQPINGAFLSSNGTFSYTRRNVIFTGLSYSVWLSTHLSNWSEDSTAIQSPTPIPGTNNELVSVTLTGAPLNDSKLFVRLSAR